MAGSQFCERARVWVSLRADGELSELESALLDAHLGGCPYCRDFAMDVDDAVAALRVARLERPAPFALVLRPRRKARRTLKGVVATAFVAAAAAAGMLTGVARHTLAPVQAVPVAVVETGESPDTLRELRRPMLLLPARLASLRNRRLPAESA